MNFSYISNKLPLILASQSPQRANILRTLGIPYKIEPSNFDEVMSEELEDARPYEVAEYFALQKALALKENYPEHMILGVDTLVVSKNDNILGKPKDKYEAAKMMRDKSGSTETVISGIALLFGKKQIVKHAVTKVFFSDISLKDLDMILNFNEWQGRSGAFSIEGKSIFYIKKIEGDYWNVVGLPVYLLGEMIKEISN